MSHAVEPCCCEWCEDPSGGYRRGDGPPVRVPAAKYGREGALCLRCYGRIVKRAKQGKSHEAMWACPYKKNPLIPCCCEWCPNPMGGATNGTGRPRRMSAAPLGREGKLCHNCFNRMVRRLDSGRSLDEVWGPPTGSECAVSVVGVPKPEPRLSRAELEAEIALEMRNDRPPGVSTRPAAELVREIVEMWDRRDRRLFRAALG